MTVTHPGRLIQFDRAPSAAITKFRFLSGLSSADLDCVLAGAKRRRYVAKAVILNQGDPADYFLLLLSGCARFFFITPEGRKVLLRWLAPGEILGAASLLPQPSPYLVSTEMVTESSVLAWDRKTIRNLALRYPKLIENALPFASEHLAWFVGAHLALISNSAGERLAHVLLSLARGLGEKVPGGMQLEITNEQLANSANVTPFTASRFLSQWQRNGALAKQRGKIVVRKPDLLFSRKKQIT